MRDVNIDISVKTGNGKFNYPYIYYVKEINSYFEQVTILFEI